MKQTKWVTHKFSDEEKRARAILRRQQELISDICQALRMNWGYQPDEWREKLESRIKTIEKQRARAVEMFPEVDDSFTVAKGTITF